LHVRRFAALPGESAEFLVLYVCAFDCAHRDSHAA